MPSSSFLTSALENISPSKLGKMDPSSSSSMSGLLREGWTGISEVISNATATTSSSHYPHQQSNNSFSLNTSSLSTNSSSNNAPAVALPAVVNVPLPPTPSASANELLELTSRLTRQLKRAEETCRRIEIREKNRVEVLRRCLVACCAKESAEVLEMALEIASNEEPEVERDSREFKELLIVRSSPDEQIEQELDRVAQLERELKEERAQRQSLQEEKEIIERRVQTQQEAWERERERFITERKSVEDAVQERVSLEASGFASRLQAIERTNRDRMQLETSRLQDKIKSLEQRLETEITINKSRKEQQQDQHVDPKQVLERDEEIAALKARVLELEDTSRPERALMSLAKNQASRERVVQSLENRVRELEGQLAMSNGELAELRSENQGAVPPEFLGPARGDYLRHVVLRYLTFDNVTQKQTLIPVIAMLLNFNPEEKKQCEQSAARDLAREGIIGTLTSSLQAMPIQIFSSSSSVSQPALTSTARYTPVATATATATPVQQQRHHHLAPVGAVRGGTHQPLPQNAE